MFGVTGGTLKAIVLKVTSLLGEFIISLGNILENQSHGPIPDLPHKVSDSRTYQHPHLISLINDSEASLALRIFV